jgi:hypothetical protein
MMCWPLLSIRKRWTLCGKFFDLLKVLGRRVAAIAGLHATKPVNKGPQLMHEGKAAVTLGSNGYHRSTLDLNHLNRGNVCQRRFPIERAKLIHIALQKSAWCGEWLGLN